MAKIFRLALLSLFVLAFPGPLWAQDAPPAIVSLAASRYVRVQANSIKVEKTGTYAPTSDSDGQASGFRIGGCYILTNVHTIVASDAYEVDGEEVSILNNVSPKYDLMLVKLPCTKPVPWIKIADTRPGKTVYAMSNAAGLDGFLVHGFVGKVDDHYLYLQEPTIPGVSGAGFLNADGELVGFGMQDQPATNMNGEGTVRYSEAIPASVIRIFLRQVLPREDLVKMGIEPASKEVAPEKAESAAKNSSK